MESRLQLVGHLPNERSWGGILARRTCDKEILGISVRSFFPPFSFSLFFFSRFVLASCSTLVVSRSSIGSLTRFCTFPLTMRVYRHVKTPFQSSKIHLWSKRLHIWYARAIVLYVQQQRVRVCRTFFQDRDRVRHCALGMSYVCGMPVNCFESYQSHQSSPFLYIACNTRSVLTVEYGMVFCVSVILHQYSASLFYRTLWKADLTIIHPFE